MLAEVGDGPVEPLVKRGGGDKAEPLPRPRDIEATPRLTVRAAAIVDKASAVSHERADPRRQIGDGELLSGAEV